MVTIRLICRNDYNSGTSGKNTKSISTVNQEYAMEETLSKDQQFLKKLTDIVIANLQNENFGVRELAMESGMSLYRLSRRLHSITTKTSNQFIREIRLKKAFDMLQEETYTVAEVAYKTGFGSPNYFHKCFHGYYGYPPGKSLKATR